jgi:hypothetical protein
MPRGAAQAAGAGLRPREVNTSGKPNWVAGVAVRWTLWDSIDRDKLAAASQRKVEQAELTEPRRSATSRCWSRRTGWPWSRRAPSTRPGPGGSCARAAAAARGRPAEGTSTTLDLIDASLNLAKVQTQRAELANQYVQALAALLESTGQSEEFDRFMAQADIQIPPDAP